MYMKQINHVVTGDDARGGEKQTPLLALKLMQIVNAILRGLQVNVILIHKIGHYQVSDGLIW